MPVANSEPSEENCMSTSLDALRSLQECYDKLDTNVILQSGGVQVSSVSSDRNNCANPREDINIHDGGSSLLSVKENNEADCTNSHKKHLRLERNVRVLPKKTRFPLVNAARERSRVQTLRSAFLDLQNALPSVPPDTKLSKLDVLVLATSYISQLMKCLENEDSHIQDMQNGGDLSTRREERDNLGESVFHPIRKWPLRLRLCRNMSSGTSDARH